ncbi:MAG: cupredoxin domain-containing protein [Nitrospirota bacterium]
MEQPGLRIGIVLCLTIIGLLWPAPPGRAGADSGQEQPVTVEIRSRQFLPDRVVLQSGRKTALVFLNQDSELHAFVPVGLFAGVNVNIAGNGAPEFDAHGFKRVIIPPDGRAEIRFVPDRPGEYAFFCDMPGHEMRATIVVQ